MSDELFGTKNLNRWGSIKEAIIIHSLFAHAFAHKLIQSPTALLSDAYYAFPAIICESISNFSASSSTKRMFIFNVLASGVCWLACMA